MNSTHVKATILVSVMVLFASAGSVSAFEEPAEGNKKLYALVKPMGSGNWKEVRPSGFFSATVNVSPGDNLMVIVYDMDSNEPLPEGRGFIKAWEPASGGSSLLLEGTSEEDIKLPEWARTEGKSADEQSKAERLMSVLNEGTKFKRHGGVIIPIIKDLPKKIKVKVGAKNHEDLAFMLKLGGSSGGGEPVDDIYLDGGILRKDVQSVVRVSKNNEEVKADSIKVLDPKGRPIERDTDTSYIEFTPETDGKYIVKVEMADKTYNEDFRTEGYSPSGDSFSVNRGFIAALILIVIAMVLTVEYKWNILNTDFGKETETI